MIKRICTICKKEMKINEAIKGQQLLDIYDHIVADHGGVTPFSSSGPYPEDEMITSKDPLLLEALNDSPIIYEDSVYVHPLCLVDEMIKSIWYPLILKIDTKESMSLIIEEED